MSIDTGEATAMSKPSRRDRPLRIALNGFGRIGRSILRILATKRTEEPVEIVLVNDVAAFDLLAYLFEYDSVFGPFPGKVEIGESRLTVGERVIPFHRTPDISRIDLTGVDVLLECTGLAKTREFAERGLRAGAKAVLISGPSPAGPTIVMGANEARLDGPLETPIVSNGSCTTHAIAPFLKALHERFGIRSAHATTIHCYTGSQPTVDLPRESAARSRAAALSMVPTSTSASKTLGEVIPSLDGKLTISAVRVPVASVSAVDFVLKLDSRPSDFVDVLRNMVGASPVLGWTDRPLVSSDLRARPESLILAGPETLLGPDMTRLLGWYDNEWGFSNRMIDMAFALSDRANRTAK
ncbi:glyceraldehyde 3-phosphate dehydrogenase [Fulvimarina manganoxydans]|uniref:Glyceraldehyde 3-phosphate dehydrogenase n=2 Tax=Fulvimarina manganoxydans TaxID=937218 RepID=A0A1W2D8L9_9HYPH|nr:glyceraldehyde 3-phosphate dehydrogenase [Fulvimarina manganoxydans]